MWLPKDERKLLRFYFSEIGDLDKQKIFDLGDLAESFTCANVAELKKQKDDCVQTDIPEKKQLLQQLIHAEKQVTKTNNLLKQRQLINLKQHEHDNNKILVSLSLDGYELGRKYNSWWIRTGLWFAEYKDHWFWLLLGFFGGIIGGILVNWLSTYFQETPGVK